MSLMSPIVLNGMWTSRLIVVLVLRHLRLQHADHGEADAADADALPDRIYAGEQLGLPPPSPAPQRGCALVVLLRVEAAFDDVVVQDVRNCGMASLHMPGVRVQIVLDRNIVLIQCGEICTPDPERSPRAGPDRPA